MNILIVDDNPTNLKRMRAQLEIEDHMVTQAQDGVEALERLDRQPVDAVISDILMPLMDGLTLTRMLKANERTRRIPIVALTAFAMKGDEQKAFDAGCDGYITKPIDTRRFPAQVAGLLANKKTKS